VPIQPGGEAAAWAELGRDELASPVQAHVEDRDDMGMYEAGSDLGLANEPPAGRRRQQGLGFRHLYGHGPPQDRVKSLPDGGAAPFAREPADRVPADRAGHLGRGHGWHRAIGRGRLPQEQHGVDEVRDAGIDRFLRIEARRAALRVCEPAEVIVECRGSFERPLGDRFVACRIVREDCHGRTRGRQSGSDTWVVEACQPSDWPASSDCRHSSARYQSLRAASGDRPRWGAMSTNDMPCQ